MSRSRTEEKRRTLRASILLDSLSGQSDEAIARQHRVSRGTVLLCIGKCLEFGLDAALGELQDRGNRATAGRCDCLGTECACQKPKELGYSYELWTYKLLTTHVRQHCVAAGIRAADAEPLQTHKILRQGELRPHKIRYYVECEMRPLRPRWQMCCTSIRRSRLSMSIGGARRAAVDMVTISYDEKPAFRPWL